MTAWAVVSLGPHAQVRKCCYRISRAHVLCASFCIAVGGLDTVQSCCQCLRENQCAPLRQFCYRRVVALVTVVHEHVLVVGGLTAVFRRDDMSLIDMRRSIYQSLSSSGWHGETHAVRLCHSVSCMGMICALPPGPVPHW